MTQPTKPDNRPFSELVTDALDQFAALVRGEVALVRAEIDEKLHRALSGIWLVVAAGIFALVSLNVLSAALVAAVAALGLATGWAALIVGVAFLALALAFWMAGAKALKPDTLTPDRTARNLRRDATTLKEAVTHDQPH